MSLQPVTRWTVHCDGDTTRGVCGRGYYGWDEEDEPATSLEQFATRREAVRTIQAYGWLVTTQRFLCPDHAAAVGYLERAAVEGLPFEDGLGLVAAMRGES